MPLAIMQAQLIEVFSLITEKSMDGEEIILVQIALLFKFLNKGFSYDIYFNESHSRSLDWNDVPRCISHLS